MNVLVVVWEDVNARTYTHTHTRTHAPAQDVVGRQTHTQAEKERQISTGDDYSGDTRENRIVTIKTLSLERKEEQRLM